MNPLKMNAEQINAYCHQNMPIYGFIGFEVIEAESHQAKCRIPLSDNNSNHFGVIHAGIQWSALEAVGGVIAFANFGVDDYLTMVKSVDIKFTVPASTDLVSEARISQQELDRIQSELNEVGKADFELEIELKNTAGEVVSSATGLYHIRKKALFRSR